MSLIYTDNRPADVAGVHAVVIGVGHYKHLPGGADENTSIGMVNMEQLSSPPHSARHVADWLFETWVDDAHLPLRSVRMLMSEEGGLAEYAHPLVPRRKVDDAVMDNIEGTLRDWSADGARNADNMMVFYFCGHGVATAVDHPLMASDSGKYEDNLFRHALNFSEFRAGMQHHAAQKQLFLVDACRVGSPDLVRNTSRGLSVIDRRNEIPDQFPRQPTLKSTLQGAEAFGLGDNPSPFAQALPKVFTGGAWRRVAGGWEVCASELANAIDARMREVLIPLGFPEPPEVEAISLTMTLKKVEGIPMVPVEVSCSDPNVTARATFRCSVGNTVIDSRDVPEQTNWFIELPRDMYDFVGDFDGANPANLTVNEYVTPPYFPCQFEVSDA